MSTVRYALVDELVVMITFDRDEKRNALSTEMAAELLRCLDRAVDEQARVIVLRANAGAKVWCAGHDLSELEPASLPVDNPTLAVARKIQSVPLPVMAMVDGGVYGGGLIMLLSADIVIASDRSEVAITSNKLGIPLSPDLYAYWMRIMGIHKAKELLFTASTITAKDAYHAGLYNQVVEPKQLEQVTLELANKIIECSPEAVANAKYQLNLIARQTTLSDEQQAEIDRRNSEILRSRDTADRIAAILSSLGRS
jgi:methylmalonyl-CoA decarboxylase